MEREATDEPNVSAEFIAVFFEHGAEECRTGLLFDLPHETQIGFEQKVRGLQWCLGR